MAVRSHQWLYDKKKGDRKCLKIKLKNSKSIQVWQPLTQKQTTSVCLTKWLCHNQWMLKVTDETTKEILNYISILYLSAGRQTGREYLQDRGPTKFATFYKTWCFQELESSLLQIDPIIALLGIISKRIIREALLFWETEWVREREKEEKGRRGKKIF